MSCASSVMRARGARRRAAGACGSRRRRGADRGRGILAHALEQVLALELDLLQGRSRAAPRPFLDRGELRAELRRSRLRGLRACRGASPGCGGHRRAGGARRGRRRPRRGALRASASFAPRCRRTAWRVDELLFEARRALLVLTDAQRRGARSRCGLLRAALAPARAAPCARSRARRARRPALSTPSPLGGSRQRSWDCSSWCSMESSCARAADSS